MLKLSELSGEKVHRGISELIQVLSVQDHLLEEVPVSLQVRLLEIKQPVRIEICWQRIEALIAEIFG